MHTLRLRSIINSSTTLCLYPAHQRQRRKSFAPDLLLHRVKTPFQQTLLVFLRRNIDFLRLNLLVHGPPSRHAIPPGQKRRHAWRRPRLFKLLVCHSRESPVFFLETNRRVTELPRIFSSPPDVMHSNSVKLMPGRDKHNTDAAVEADRSLLPRFSIHVLFVITGYIRRWDARASALALGGLCFVNDIQVTLAPSSSPSWRWLVRYDRCSGVVDQLLDTSDHGHRGDSKKHQRR